MTCALAKWEINEKALQDLHLVAAYFYQSVLFHYGYCDRRIVACHFACRQGAGHQQISDSNIGLCRTDIDHMDSMGKDSDMVFN